MLEENWGEYIFEVSLHFDNIESVNHGFESVMSKDQFAKGLFFTPFESSGDRFVRNYVHQDYSSIQGWDRNLRRFFRIQNSQQYINLGDLLILKPTLNI